MLKLCRLTACSAALIALVLAGSAAASAAGTEENEACSQPPEAALLACPFFGCECDIRTTCGPEVFNGMVDFVRQKDNLKCVYRCHTAQTCTTRTCCPNREPVCDIERDTIDGAFRVRIGPYPLNACPAADPGFCDGSIPVEIDDGGF